MKRRGFLLAAVGTSGLAAPLRASPARPRRLLLRSSWQTVNIGDVAHTPGMLALLEEHLPDVEPWLWPSRIDGGVEELLRRRFPRLRIVTGDDGVREAFAECDFLLHGSGPSLVAEKDVVRWRDATGKPFGVYGITLPPQPSTATTPVSDDAFARTLDLLGDARFVFFRDPGSLDLARMRGCAAPIVGFAPDAAFATDLRDDRRAETFLESHGLKEGGFLCCIPRLRYTPYWTVAGKRAAFDPRKHARNEAMKEHDHAPHRQAIVDVVRGTSLKVLLCPEDATQMAVGRELLYEPLPADVKRRVVWRPDYWLTGEAISTYVRSAGLFGNEMHSPIMCIGHGVPAIVCRWAEQTSKGLMWREIGLAEWLFDFDVEEDVRRLPGAVLELARDPEGARGKAASARQRVRRRQAETMAILKRELESS
jgi:polysaccharide pyruvyl transferase WcaK-like protein